MLKNVLIGTNVSYTSAATPSLLAAGEIGVYSMDPTSTVNSGFTLITTTPSAAQLVLPIMIAQGPSAGRSAKSFVIQPKMYGKSYLNSAYVAPVPSAWTAGYDGVTATYSLASGMAGTYGFKIQNTTMGNPPFPTLSSTPYFDTLASATAIAIANAIVKDVNSQALLPANLVVPYENFAFSEVLSSAVTATTTQTATVTNGSPNVTLAAGIAAVAGDYLRFGSATSTSAAVYKIKSIATTAVVLETPYVNTQIALGASITGLVNGFATAATVNAATAGIRVVEYGNRFNGSTVLEPQPNTVLNLACSVNLSGTPMQNNQTVAKGYTGANGVPTGGIYTEGAGIYSQIFKKELWAAGYSGYANRSFLPDNFPIYTVAGTNYSTIGLEYMALVKDYTAQGFHAGETMNAIIAVPASAQFTALAAILNSTNGYFSV